MQPVPGPDFTSRRLVLAWEEQLDRAVKMPDQPTKGKASDAYDRDQLA